MIRRVVILGSTGSIGVQTVEVIEHVNALYSEGRSPVGFKVVGLGAGGNTRLLCEQARRLNVPLVACASGDIGAADLPAACRVLRGPESAEALVPASMGMGCELVVGAIVGVAGLRAVLGAIDEDIDIALANKETLVAAGELMTARARLSGSRILPVDSEHAALWQCLATSGKERDGLGPAPPFMETAGLARAFLTASGGPFRSWPRDRIERATREDALRHPTWRMGEKVTVDCASLMNKALELIEAHWLFGLPAAKLGVLIHPQSTVHAIAEFEDGSSVAQLAPPDMRLPIQRALCWPSLVPGPANRMDWASPRSLEFEPPDVDRFPMLAHAWRVMKRGGTSGAIVNAANEEAVRAFLAGAIPFGEIARAVDAVCDAVRPGDAGTLERVLEADAAARDAARAHLARRGVAIEGRP
ncbi:MAG TPA: 1-deoxy-D-xylulose-5-phosphate reductoisomerase [Phycisphaerales bacterium]|nr:1-deoxy-D-xylulose-5-phosphate reductoisomerase [Phycisphaerales bacterium]